jgi:hypothetical protein
MERTLSVAVKSMLATFAKASITGREIFDTLMGRHTRVNLRTIDLLVMATVSIDGLMEAIMLVSFATASSTAKVPYLMRTVA